MKFIELKKLVSVRPRRQQWDRGAIRREAKLDIKIPRIGEVTRARSRKATKSFINIIPGRVARCPLLDKSEPYKKKRKKKERYTSVLLKAYKNPKALQGRVTRRMGDDAWKERVFHFFFPRFAARFGARGCTWRLVKGLTYDVLPCRSVECGSSTTAAATALYHDTKGYFFVSLFFILLRSVSSFSLLFLLSSLFFSFSLSARSRRFSREIKRPEDDGHEQRTRRRTVSQRLSPGNIEC